MDTFWGLSSGENLILYTNNKGADQTAQMRSLVSPLVIRYLQKW